MSGSGDSGRIDLEDARFDPESGDLEGPDGLTTRVAPQPGRLLTLLIEGRGTVVGRDDVATHLWPGGSVEVDQGIAFAVREIRKAFEAVGADPTMIETIPRRGYRLRAEDRPPTSTARPRTRIGPGVLLLAAAIVIASAAWWRTGPAPIPVLAQFPHSAMDGDPSRALAAELSDMLTTRLTQDLAGRMGVVGPTGLGSLSGPSDTDGALERLGACLVLSGEVRPVENGRIAVFTQVVRTEDRVHVWARLDTVSAGTPLTPTARRIVAGVDSAIEGC